MQFFTKILFVILLASATPVIAEHAQNNETISQRPTRTLNGYDILIDVVLRPVGLVGTIAGTALYVGLSPFTLMSQAFPPHNSFEKLGKLLVVQPAKYTFARPVGDYAYASSY
jgi:hypothetical protein